jgi:indole-3-glycerol phosphate synthase
VRILARLAAAARGRAEAARARQPLEELRRRVRDLPPVRPLPGRPFAIAEFKRASPSRGAIDLAADPVERGRAYVAAGARAVSCLTDPDFFGARPDDFPRLRAALDVPLLRKDFIVDPYQVWETRAMGADLCLLIVRLLGERLPAFLAEAEAAGLPALVEVHDADEAERALTAGARIVGVNARDLDTFTVDVPAALRLLAAVPAPVRIAESGLTTPEAVRAALDAGADGVLIGEAAMREPGLIGAVTAT